MTMLLLYKIELNELWYLCEDDALLLLAVNTSLNTSVRR